MIRQGRHAWLHALVLLAFVLMFGLSFAMISTLVGITSPWLALLLMLYFLGLGKVAEPLFMLKMPKGLYALRPWEQEPVVARRLRIASFGRLLRRTPLRYLNSDVYAMIGDPAAAIIADIYAFGGRSFSTRLALKDMLAQADSVNTVRPG